MQLSKDEIGNSLNINEINILILNNKVPNNKLN
jgi:hypothetical protein